MSFSIFPTNIGGVSLSGILGPLGSLLTPKQKLNNLMYPLDLGNNPSMGHAVIIQAYDYSTIAGTSVLNSPITQGINSLISGAANIGSAVQNGNIKGAFNELSGQYNKASSAFGGLTGNGATQTVADSLSTINTLISAKNYQPVTPSEPLATISLFMPDTLNIDYNANYSEVSLTQELGLAGFVSNAIADRNNTKAYAITGMTQLAQKALGVVPFAKPQDIGSLAAAGAGVVVNPQIQLLFKAVALRTFQLEFMLTPKTSKEAETVKNIVDSLTFYSLPGVSGGQVGKSGQYLTPPQIFKIDFKFLGETGIISNISNIISSALNNSGLSFLTSGTDAVKNGSPAKIFSVKECVLENVMVDYAPNGWASYNDGYPIQTRLTLQFKEMQMPTKESISNAALQSNYSTANRYNTNLFSEQTNMLMEQDRGLFE